MGAGVELDVQDRQRELLVSLVNWRMRTMKKRMRMIVGKAFELILHLAAVGLRIGSKEVQKHESVSE